MSNMNLYLLSRYPTGLSYDVVNSMVVRAESEEQARAEAALKAMDEGYITWVDDTKSDCQIITVEGEPQVLCVDGTNG